MINGTIKGEIVSRMMYSQATDSRGYAGQMRVKVRGYVDGQQTETHMLVFFPEFMRKRLDYFMKPETKYCVIIFDTMSVVEAPAEGFPVLIGLRANRIEG